MKTIYQLFFTALLALTVSACSSSSSSSSTGAGFIVSGSYNGTLNSTNTDNRSFSTRLTINLNQSQDSSADGNTLSDQITGTFAFAGGDQCWNGGTISGTVNGSNINLTLTPNDADSSDIVLAGQQENNNFTSGTFSANNSEECGSVSGAFTLQRR